MAESLGTRLAQARREKGVRERRDITRAEIADAAGVDPSMVTDWERDRKVPREANLERLAAFLNVTPAFLRYGMGGVSSHAEVELINPALDRKLTREEIDRARAQVAAAHASKTTAKRPTRKRGNGKG